MHVFGISITRSGAKPRVTELDGVRLTPAQQLAYMQAEHAADQMMSAIRWAKNLAWLILIIVMAVSYEDQERYLERIKMSHWAATLIPFVFDAATVLCVKVIGTYAMQKMAKLIALLVVMFPVSASAFINVQASPTTAVAIVYVLVVALIPAIELIKAFIGADFTKMRGVEANLLSSVKANTISEDELARRKAHGQKISAGREAAKQAKLAAAEQAKKDEDERLQALRERGLKAAETRKLRELEEKQEAEEAEAAQAVEAERLRKAALRTARKALKTPVQRIEDLEASPVNV